MDGVSIFAPTQIKASTTFSHIFFVELYLEQQFYYSNSCDASSMYPSYNFLACGHLKVCSACAKTVTNLKNKDVNK